MNYKRKIFLYFLFFIFNFSFSFAQKRQVDSLYAVLKTEKQDSDKMKTYYWLAIRLHAVDPDTALVFAHHALDIATRLGIKKSQSSAYNAAGMSFWIRGDLDSAISNYQKALVISKEIDNKRGQSVDYENLGNAYADEGDYVTSLDCFNRAYAINLADGNKQRIAADLGDIGTTYEAQGQYPKALDYYFKSLSLDEEIGDKTGQVRNLGNIGIIYKDEHDYDHALEYHNKALKMAEEIGDKRLQIDNISNMGLLYEEKGVPEKALDYDMKALAMDKEIESKLGQAIDMNNIGVIYFGLKEYDKALEYYNNALNLAEEIGDKHGIAAKEANIGGVYIKTGKFKQAEDYITKAIVLDSSIGNLNDLRQFEEALSQLYDTTGRYKLALGWYRRSVTIKDTLFNIDKNKALTRREVTYQFEKKEAEQKATQDKKDALTAAEAKRQRIITIAIAVVLLLVLAFAVFIFRSLNLTRKQKTVIEEQKKQVDGAYDQLHEKHREITDSINYAKRIQRALFKSEEYVTSHLPEHFVLFKPKDVVSGDFYWGHERPPYWYVAAVDCTGHGVPGAFLTMLGSAFLNEICADEELMPGEVLDRLREKVIKELAGQGEVKDGMDISLCRINMDTRQVLWAGANNPLWVLNKGALVEIKADKQPIGYQEGHKPFTTHTVTLVKGDMIYLFTDGYADQFGGAKGKKYKYKPLSEKLVSLGAKAMEEQKQELDKEFEAWRGNLEQTDDVCVIGIRI